MRGMSLEVFANALNVRIEAAYRDLGHDLGWRLLYSPLGVLEGARVAFIGLNPGGDREVPEHGRMAPLSGSAFVTERWKSSAPGGAKRQKTIRQLFDLTGVEAEAVLAGNLVPFRSRSWAELREHGKSTAFGRSVWQDIIRRANPTLIVCDGGAAFRALMPLVSAAQEEWRPAGWGDWKVRRARFETGIVAGLPHLSIYTVGSDRDRAAAVRWALGQE